MQESNDDIARRVLAAVLGRLEASGSQQHEASALNQRSYPAGDPVVVIVLGHANSNSSAVEEMHRPLNEAPFTRAMTGSQPSFGDALHPGLEKFEQLKPNPNARAPKTCFMEPDRPCVNSGACEIRGY